RGLTAAKLPAWLINGDQFFGAYHPFESYEGQHPESFRRMMAELKKTRLPMAFLSGDRHLTEIMSIEPAQLGYRTYEVTTSAIHAKTFPGSFKKDPNPRQLVGKDGTFNYLVLKTRAEKGLRFTAAVFGPAGRTLFEKTLHVRGGGAKGPS